jgi:hypothetical protein
MYSFREQYPKNRYITKAVYTNDPLHLFSRNLTPLNIFSIYLLTGKFQSLPMRPLSSLSYSLILKSLSCYSVVSSAPLLSRSSQGTAIEDLPVNRCTNFSLTVPPHFLSADCPRLASDPLISSTVNLDNCIANDSGSIGVSSLKISEALL